MHPLCCMFEIATHVTCVLCPWQVVRCSCVTFAAIRSCLRWWTTPITTSTTRNIDSSRSRSTFYRYGKNSLFIFFFVSLRFCMSVVAISGRRLIHAEPPANKADRYLLLFIFLLSSGARCWNWSRVCYFTPHPSALSISLSLRRLLFPFTPWPDVILKKGLSFFFLSNRVTIWSASARTIPSRGVPSHWVDCQQEKKPASPISSTGPASTSPSATVYPRSPLYCTRSASRNCTRKKFQPSFFSFIGAGPNCAVYCPSFQADFFLFDAVFSLLSTADRIPWGLNRRQNWLTRRLKRGSSLSTGIKIFTLFKKRQDEERTVHSAGAKLRLSSM